MRPYRSKYIPKTLPSALDEAAVVELEGIYDEDLDEGEWNSTDLGSTREGSDDTGAKEICDYFHKVQAVRRETNLDVVLNHLELLTDLAKGSACVLPSVAGSSSVEQQLLQSQCPARRKEDVHTWDQSDACGSEFVKKLGNAKTTLKELWKALDACPLHIPHLEVDMTKWKVI